METKITITPILEQLSIIIEANKEILNIIEFAPTLEIEMEKTKEQQSIKLKAYSKIKDLSESAITYTENTIIKCNSISLKIRG